MNTVATIHACIGWPLTITAYPVSDSHSSGFLAYNILQWVLLLAWSMYSAKVISSYHMWVTASPPNPRMHLCVLEIGAHVDLWKTATSRLQWSFRMSWGSRSQNFSRVGKNLGRQVDRHIWKLLVLVVFCYIASIRNTCHMLFFIINQKTWLENP
jgi:hypothetical protein